MTKFFKGLTYLVLLVFVVAYFSGALDDSPSKSKLSDEKIASMDEFLAPEICLEFAENKIRAEDEWKGKIAKVKGQIRSIAVDAFGAPFMLLDCSPILGKKVRFVLPKEDKSKLKDFSIGDFVTGVGTVKPAVLGEIWIEDVRIVKKGL